MQARLAALVLSVLAGAAHPIDGSRDDVADAIGHWTGCSTLQRSTSAPAEFVASGSRRGVLGSALGFGLEVGLLIIGKMWKRSRRPPG